MCEESIRKTMVKICGLRRPEDALAANLLKPDLAGFILTPGFRRSIDPEQAQRLRQILFPVIRTVGVFVDAPQEEILRAEEGGWIDMIQLHGKEDDSYIKKLAALTDLPIIKAFRIQEKRDLETAAASTAEWILLDSGNGTGKTFDWDLLESFLQEHAADSPEGLSEEEDKPSEIEDSPSEAEDRSSEIEDCLSEAEDRHGQQAAENLQSTPLLLFPGGHHWLLAGGLSAENVGAAIRRFRPTAVDVSSKVETDGFKDPAKMEAFLQAARMKP